MLNETYHVWMIARSCMANTVGTCSFSRVVTTAWISPVMNLVFQANLLSIADNEIEDEMRAIHRVGQCDLRHSIVVA